MNDFKGTKGEFKTSLSTFINQEIEVSGNVARACVIPYADEEGLANAKLFANSKKVLEALIELLSYAPDGQSERPTAFDNGLLSAIGKAKQAINDSL